jgi:uncharacterized protein
MRRDWQQAVDSGDPSAVLTLVRAGAGIDVRDRYNQTGLMRAATRGHLRVVRVLLDHGANLDVSAKYGLTALMLAIVNHHADVALALIEAGAALEHRGSGAPGFADLTALDLARARDPRTVVAAIEARAGLDREAPA